MIDIVMSGMFFFTTLRISMHISLGSGFAKQTLGEVEN